MICHFTTQYSKLLFIHGETIWLSWFVSKYFVVSAFMINDQLGWNVVISHNGN